MTSDWKLDQKKKSLYEITSDLDEGYFVMAYLLLTNRPKNLELNHLSECTRYLFGLDNSYQWRPVITFSSDDEKKINEFTSKIQMQRKNIMLETHHKSDQSKWNVDMTMKTLKICRKKFVNCNFFFASDVQSAILGDDIYFCEDLTLREISLLHDRCDLFIGVSSGISVAVSTVKNKLVPKIQYCADYWCSTFPITDSPMELVTDDISSNLSRNSEGKIKKIIPDKDYSSKDNFYLRLKSLIDKIINNKL